MEKSSKRLLTLIECESRTGRKVSTWRKAIVRREVPYVQLGRSVRIPEEYIDGLIQEGWRDPIESVEA